MVRTTNYKLYGDKESAKQLMGLAQIQLEKLRNLMQFANLKQYGISMVDESGFIINVSSVFGAEKVDVFFPTKEQHKEMLEELVKPVYMIWHIEPPYIIPIVKTGDNAYKLDKNLLLDDPDVVGGHYFLVSIFKGSDVNGIFLNAKFTIKEDLGDSRGVIYSGWTIEQGIREGVEVYKKDGKTATVRMLKTAKGAAKIVASDGQSMLFRKIFYAIATWKILYIPTSPYATGNFIVANKSTLNPTTEMAKGIVPEYYGEIPSNISTMHFVSGSGSTEYSFGGAVSVGGPVMDGSGDNFGHHFESWHRVYWMKRTEGGTQNPITVNVGTLWSKSYASHNTAGSFRAQKTWTQWTTVDGIGEEPDAPTKDDFDWDPYDGFSAVKVINQETRYCAVINAAIYDVASENDTWYKDSTHGGFFVARVLTTQDSFHLSDQGHSAGWSADCPWIEAAGSNSIMTHSLYYIHNEVEYLISEANVTYDGQSIVDFSGEYGSPILLKCYKKENLNNDNGEEESEDVTVLSYFLGSVWNTYTHQVETVTKTGYMMISSDGDIKKEFDSNSVGVHDLININSINYQGNGQIVLHTF